MKRQIIIVLIFSILVLLLLQNSSDAVVSPTTNFYVNDYAGILSEETKQYILSTNIDLERKTGAQIVVVTVKSLEGITIEEYANKLFNTWKIGDDVKNNGLLLLCATDERQFRVEVGYGLEGDLPDGKTGRMQDEYIIPYLKNNNYDEGIKNGYNAFLTEVAGVYGVTIEGIQVAFKNESTKMEMGFQSLSVLYPFCILATAISFRYFLRKKTRLTFIIYLGIEVFQFILFCIILKSLQISFMLLAMGMLSSFGGRIRGGFHGGGPSGGGFSGRRRFFWWWRK